MLKVPLRALCHNGAHSRLLKVKAAGERQGLKVESDCHGESLQVTHEGKEQTKGRRGRQWGSRLGRSKECCWFVTYVTEQKLL